MRRARTVVKDLKDISGADRWAPREYAAVTSGLQAAEKELSAQTARWSMNRDYARASIMFSSLLQEAEIARKAAEGGRKSAAREAKESLDALVSAIEHARAAMRVVPMADGGGAARRIGADVDGAIDESEAIQNLIAAGDFSEASKRGRESLDHLNATLRSLARSSRR